MNTEHTNQPRQAANAAFEQWWQRHGLKDPMDDEDRQYATASSWARRGYLAAMGLATIKDSLTVAQQAEPVNQQQAGVYHKFNVSRTDGRDLPDPAPAKLAPTAADLAKIEAAARKRQIKQAKRLKGGAA